MLFVAGIGIGALIGGGLYFKRKMGNRREKPSFLVEVAPGRLASPGKPATGPTYRNVIAKDGYATLPGVTTLYELFTKSVETYPDNDCLGHRPKVWLVFHFNTTPGEV
jgi:hypothetical protein